MSIKKSLLLILAYISLIGCQSTHNKESLKIPTWVTSPPQDTVKIFYGLGSGYNLKTANAAALKDASGKLGITVSSIYEQHEQISNESYQKHIDEQVKLSIENTPISQYQVLKNEVVQDQVYSLIQVSKPQILRDSKQRLEKQNQIATKILQQKSTTNTLVWYFQAQQLLKSTAEQAYRYAAIINLLMPVKKLSSELAPWTQLYSQVQQTKANLCITIINENNNSTDFINVLTNHLSKQHIKITKNCQERIFINSTEQTNFIYQKYISSNNIQFTLQDKHNANIASHSLTMAGQSVSSYSNARKAAAAQLKNKLVNANIWTILQLTE